MSLRLLGFATLAFTLAAAAPPPNAAPARIAYTYADLADLSLSGQVAAHVRIRSAIQLRGAQAAQVPPGITRYFIEADVVSLIRSPSPLPARVRYLADFPNAAEGGKPRRKGEYLVIADPVAGRAGELRLVDEDAHIPWTAATTEQVRTILREASAPGAAPRIVGLGKAFHVPGTLPGESETQFFLNAEDGRPISLTVLRRPGQAPQWSVALGEIVDEAAAAPTPGSLLWYRLACHLPRSLPEQSVADAAPAEAAAIRTDYALVLEQLGACPRSRAGGPA
jgi:hypothetical protein